MILASIRAAQVHVSRRLLAAITLGLCVSCVASAHQSKPYTTEVYIAKYTVDSSHVVMGLRRSGRNKFVIDCSKGWASIGSMKRRVFQGGIWLQGEQIGELDVDFAVKERPVARIRMRDAAGRVLTQAWRAFEDRSQIHADTSGARADGGLPIFGQHVYVDVLPEPIHRVRPLVPKGAKVDAASRVMVYALVGADGRVLDTRVTQSVLGLDEAAVAALRQWRFKPARSAGRPVAVWLAVPVRFTR